MITALLVAAVFLGLSTILSLEGDKFRKELSEMRKSEEDRLYKLSVTEEIEEKIAYTTDPEKIIDIIMVSLRNFFNYSVASSMIVKDAHTVFKIYKEESVGEEYIKKVQNSMLSSFEKLIGKLPAKIDRKEHGAPIDKSIKSTYSSSFHIPLIANNRVLALIHLSSTKENTYSNMQDLRDIIETASSALTHFSQAVETETKKLLSLINSINDGILLVDNRNNLLNINETARKILGTSPTANYSDIVTVFGENFNLEKIINEVILSKNPYFAKEIQVSDKTLSIFVNPVDNEKVSIVLHDMTEYKKKEMQKEDLIHIMVHELRAPTTSIKDSAELIITSKDFEEDRKAKFMEIIHTQAKKVLGQIGSILDTAKLEAGKLVLQKAPGDIAKLVKEEIQTFTPQAQRKGIDITFETISKSIPQFSFDEIRISQVVDNLLSNSLKFTPEKGKIKIKIDYATIPPVLDGISPMGEFLSLDKYIIVSVFDNGIGIPEEQEKKLFSKYTQAQNADGKLPSMGTGLGLYLARGIVEAHEGRIWVKSTPGQGTTFSFSLPTTIDPKTSHTTPKPATMPLIRSSQTIN